jgi:hypothetical protein
MCADIVTGLNPEKVQICIFKYVTEYIIIIIIIIVVVVCLFVCLFVHFPGENFILWTKPQGFALSPCF